MILIEVSGIVIVENDPGDAGKDATVFLPAVDFLCK